MGITPGPIPADVSPVKIEGRVSREEALRLLMSSSPPPMDGVGSPSKSGPGRGFGGSAVKRMGSDENVGRERGETEDVEMRERSVSVSVSAAPNSNSASAIGANGMGAQGHFAVNANAKNGHGNGNAAGAAGVGMSGKPLRPAPPPMNGNDDEEEDEGFDLAKGFAPIAGVRGVGSVNAR
jgi:hypothetical protein